MPNQLKQFVRLVYNDPDAFASQSAGKTDFSAFVLDEDGLALALRKDASPPHVISSPAVKLAELQATATAQAGQIAILGGQAGHAAGATTLGSLNAPRTVSGFAYDQNSAGKANPLTAIPSEIRILSGSQDWIGNVYVGTDATQPELFEFYYRVVSGDPNLVRAYQYLEDAQNETGAIAQAYCDENATGIWPFVTYEGNTWGWLEITSGGIDFYAHDGAVFSATPARRDFMVPEALLLPGTRFVFDFTLGANWDTDATSIAISASLGAHSLHGFESFEFPIPSEFFGLIHGRLTFEFQGQAPTGYQLYHWRSRLQVRANFPDGFRNIDVQRIGEMMPSAVEGGEIRCLNVRMFMLADYAHVDELVLIDSFLTVYPPLPSAII